MRKSLLTLTGTIILGTSLILFPYGCKKEPERKVINTWTQKPIEKPKEKPYEDSTQLWGETEKPKTAEKPICYHKIMKGDTLSEIAKEYNTSIKNLMRLNPNIKDKNLIKEDYQPIKLREGC